MVKNLWDKVKMKKFDLLLEGYFIARNHTKERKKLLK